MTHSKVTEAFEAAKSAKARADKAQALAIRMDELKSWISRLHQFPTMQRVEACGVSYTVPEAARLAMGAMLLDAYEAELTELRKKLESI